MSVSKILKSGVFRPIFILVLALLFICSLSQAALAANNSSSSSSSASSTAFNPGSCCAPAYVRKIITGRCTFSSLSLVRKLVKEKVREFLVNQGCSGVRTTVRVSRETAAREDVGLKNIITASSVDGDGLTFRVDGVNAACTLPVVIQITTRFKDRFGARTQRTYQSTVNVAGEYR